MIKYRLHNITDFGVELHDFYTENALNNYIAVFVDPPYWIENLETHKNTYTGFTCDDISERELKYLENDILGLKNLIHESEIDWIKRHTHTEEKEAYSKSEKIFNILVISSVIIMATLLLLLFLHSVSFIAEYLSSFTWHIFNIL